MKKAIPFLPALLATCFLLHAPVQGAEQEADGSAQGRKPEAGASSLAIRQEGVGSEVRNLEQKLLRLVQLLREEDPRQAERLSEALKAAREAMLRKRMERISFLLNEVNLDAATAEQEEIIADLVALLKNLTEEDDYYERLRERLQQLEEWRRQINELSREEWRQMRQSQKASDPESALSRLADHIGRLKSLMEEQEDVLEDTGQSRESGAANLSALAQKQREVRKATESLLGDMSQTPDLYPEEGDEVPGPQESPGQAPPSEARAPEPGQKALERATKGQHESEKSLASGKARSAESPQKRALDAMHEALAEMEREKKELDSLSPDHADRLAKEQDATARKTGSLAKEMDTDEQSTGGEGGQTGQGGQGGGQSGAQKSLQQARESMQGASGQLRKKQPGPAAQTQKRAHQELQKARSEIDRELSQLRKEQRGALLAKLIAMFRQMLDRQQGITGQTTDLQQMKQDGNWGRTASLRCAELADGEGDLNETAAEALRLMEENSPAVVFPNAVRGLRSDLKATAARLREEKTGETTRSIQQNVEQTLEDLINALEMAQENPPPPDQQQSGQGQQSNRKPPLIGLLNEIKLLRNMQLRINQRTENLRERMEQKNAAPDLQQRAETLSRRQNTVRQMTEELRERIRRALQGDQQQKRAPTL
jgi:hypothetical protein